MITSRRAVGRFAAGEGYRESAISNQRVDSIMAMIAVCTALGSVDQDSTTFARSGGRSAKQCAKSLTGVAVTCCSGVGCGDSSAVLKTAVRESVPWVRIPAHPLVLCCSDTTENANASHFPPLLHEEALSRLFAWSRQSVSKRDTIRGYARGHAGYSSSMGGSLGVGRERRAFATTASSTW